MPKLNIHKKISSQFSLSVKGLEEPNGITFIIGPNGAGKSSLLQELWRLRRQETCFYLPSENQIDLGISLSEYLSILETKLPPQLSEFENQKDRVLSQFSSGQRQRIVTNTSVSLNGVSNFFLDEPTNYLDPHFKLELMDSLLNSPKNHYICTNDFSWCIQFSTASAILLGNGTLLSQGPVRQVVESDEMAKAFHLKFQVKQELNSKLLQLNVDR